MRTLHVLIGKRLADLAMLVAIQKSQSTSAAIALVKTSVGFGCGEAVKMSWSNCASRESAEHLVAKITGPDP